MLTYEEKTGEKKLCTESANATNYLTTQTKRVKTEVPSHHLGLAPGTLSALPASPPECLFLPNPPFTGDFPTNVGPLDTGLSNAGVDVVFVLQSTTSLDKGPNIDFAGKSCRIRDALLGL